MKDITDLPTSGNFFGNPTSHNNHIATPPAKIANGATS